MPTTTRKPPDLGLLRVNGHATPNHFDVFRALKVTTHAIRFLLNYLHPFSKSMAIPSPNRVSARWTSPFTSKPQKLRVSSREGCPDPLVRIRRAALDVLSLLREMEESKRLPLWDDAYDAGSNRRSGAHCVADGADGCVNGRFILGVCDAGRWGTGVDCGVGRGRRAQRQKGDQAVAAGTVGRIVRASQQWRFTGR